MHNPRFKIERRKHKLSIFNIFLIFLFIRCIEYYYLLPYLSIDSKGIVTAAVGITIMFFYQRLVFGNLQSLGLVIDPMRIFKWIRVGVLLSLLPFVFISTVEFISYKIIGTEFLLKVYSYGYTLDVFGGFTWLLAIVICSIISVLKATLFETLYRGLILSKLKKLFSFNVSNCLQSLLYMIWFLVIPLRYFIYKTPGYDTKRIIDLCLFYIVFEFMSAFKWGLLTRASGAVWVSLIDHITFDFLTATIHFIKPLGDENLFLRAFMVQLVSLCMTIVYYYYRKKKRPALFSDTNVTNQANDTAQKPEIMDYEEALGFIKNKSDNF